MILGLIFKCEILLNNNGIYESVSSGYAPETIQQLQLLKAVIEKTFQMDEIIEAHRHVDTGRKKGSVVLKINEWQEHQPLHCTNTL